MKIATSTFYLFLLGEGVLSSDVVRRGAKNQHINTGSRDLKGTDSSKSKKSKGKGKALKGKEVCLVSALQYTLEGPANEPFACSTAIEARPLYPGNEDAYYVTNSGTVTINREDAGLIDFSLFCAVSYYFDEITETSGDSRDAVCLRNVCDLAGNVLCNDQKGVIQTEIPEDEPIRLSQLEEFSYTYNPLNYGNGNVGEIYVNIYTIQEDNDMAASPCTFYSCVIDATNFGFADPPINTFTTVTIGPDDALFTRIREFSTCPGTCPLLGLGASSSSPVSLRDMQTELTNQGTDLVLGIASTQPYRYAFILNMGDTGGTEDNGMEVCFDKFSYKLYDEDSVIFNFEVDD